MQEIATRVCNLPAEFHRRGDVSIIALVAESGSASVDPAALRHAVMQHLRVHSELIDDWLTYSADKRTGRGWYLEDANPVVLGYYDPRLGKSRERQYADRAEGCAEFIMREVAAFSGD